MEMDPGTFNNTRLRAFLDCGEWVLVNDDDGATEEPNDDYGHCARCQPCECWCAVL